MTIVTHDDTEVTCNWSVSRGPFTEWLKEQLSNCMAKSHTVEVQIDKNQERMAFIQLNAERLGWYLLPEFIDIAGFLPVFLEMPEQVEYQLCGASDTVRCQTSTSTIWGFSKRML